MQLETEYFNLNISLFSGLTVNPPDLKVITGFGILILLLLGSALMSASEVAFFSLSPPDIRKIKADKSKRSKALIKLYEMPERLLSTILVGNNSVNVAIVILSAFLSSRLFNFSETPVLGFIIEVVAITFLILFFGEIMPKVYATKKNIPVALFMALPLIALEKIFRPITYLLLISGTAPAPDREI
jgi:putative hemolysin